MTLYHGDSLSILRELPDESIDLVLTDPPYSSGGQFRSDRAQSTTTKYVQTGTIDKKPEFMGDNRDQRGYLAWCSLWLAECHRVLKPGRAAIVFTDWRQLPTTTDAIQAGGLVWRGIVVWDKTEASRPLLGVNAQAEYAIWGTKGPTDLGHEVYLKGVIRAAVPRGDERIHQTQKPLGLIEKLCGLCPPGGVVLDPFAGSGTTLLAARTTGRRAIGVELDRHYIEVAAGRLDTLSLMAV